MNKGVFAILFCALAATMFAESLVKFPTGPSSWTVNCGGKSENGTDSSIAETKRGFPLKRIDVAQNDTTRRSIIHWASGKSRELWSLSNMDVVLTEDPSGSTLVSGNTLLHGDPFSPSSFDWIKASTRADDKVVTYEGKACNHYKGFVVIPNPTGEGPPETIPVEAWIDAKTLLPVALKKGDTLGIFSFGDPPSNLDMPERFRSRLEYYKITMGMR